MKYSKMDIYKRRLAVREYVLKGFTEGTIAKKLEVEKGWSVSPFTVKEDIKEINKWYIQAVSNNKHLLQRQAEHILKHLDQLRLIKQKLWDVEADSTSARNKIAALKAILSELEHESRILKLIDTSSMVIKQYIHIDKMSVVMEQISELVTEFVPEEKRKYAFSRLQNIGDTLKDKDIEDGEITSS